MSQSSQFGSCFVMAKPTGAVCNLDCTYCFYLEKEKLYPERNQNWKMDDATLEAYIQQQIAAQDGEHVDFAWQGGEPTLMGLEFFQRVVELQQQYAGDKKIANMLQTNALLLNDDWCRFLHQHDFLVGVSIDGPADLHDHYRVNRAGRGTHAQVVAAIERLKQHKVRFNTLTVINAQNVAHPERIYEHLTELGSDFLQFIPLVEREATNQTTDGLTLVNPDQDIQATVTDWSVDPVLYGQFLNQVFDRWISKDVGRVYVQMFEVTLAAWCQAPPQLCIFAPQCGHSFALEANGDLYDCDHYVFPEHKLGNIHQHSIREMNNSEQAKAFGEAKYKTLSQDCRQCDYQFACYGGCPKHRFANSSAGKPEHNYLCAGYKAFFQHSAPHMSTMRELIKRQRPVYDVMALRKQHLARQFAGSIKRNDNCFCGSGLKYKKCCAKITA